MATKNMEIFNRIVVLLFARLYEHFPDPIDIDTSAIGLEAMPEDEADQRELWNSMLLGTESLNWLEQEGFITVQSKTLESDFGGVRLTLRGLTLMKTPSSLDDSESDSFGEKAQAVIGGAVRDSASDLVKQLLQAAIKYAPSFF